MDDHAERSEAAVRWLKWNCLVKCSFPGQMLSLHLKNKICFVVKKALVKITEPTNCCLLPSGLTIIPWLAVSRLDHCEIFIHEQNTMGQLGIQSCGQLNLSGADWQTISCIINQRGSPASADRLCLSSPVPRAGVIKCKWLYFKQTLPGFMDLFESIHEKSHHNIWGSFLGDNVRKIFTFFGE